jgi:hypothetical protein
VTWSAAPVASEASAFEVVIVVVRVGSSIAAISGRPSSKFPPRRCPKNAPRVTFGIECWEEEERGDTMLFDRQKFVLAVDQALKEHDKDKDKAVDSGGHNIAIDCDNELEHFAYRILELME